MLNTLRTQIRNIIYAVLLIAPPAFASGGERTQCKVERVEGLPANRSICFSGRLFKLQYDSTKRIVTLSTKGEKTRIEKLEKGYTPELIDMVEFIRFLPSQLQPYESRGILLLNTAARSTGGGGGGQCGAGYELYLNAVDVSRSPFKVLGRVKIGSCLESTFLYDMENGPDDYSSFSIKEGKLAIKFLAYQRKRGAPTAVLSDDFRSLELLPQQTSSP
jgi:hypothetical protein